MKLGQYCVVQWSQSAYKPEFYEASFPTNHGASPMNPPENFLKECSECIAIGYVPTGSMGMTVVEVDNGTFLCYQQSFYHPNWTSKVKLTNTYRAVLVSWFDPVLGGARVQSQIEKITGLPEDQCREIVESLSEIKSNLSRTEADQIASVIKGAGGEVHIYNMLGELVSGDTENN
jgi:hypothetical protein